MGSSREVTAEMGEKCKEEEGFDFFIETSAKTGFNAENLFIEAVKELYIDYMSYNDVSSRISNAMTFQISQYQEKRSHPQNKKPKKDVALKYVYNIIIINKYNLNCSKSKWT